MQFLGRGYDALAADALRDVPVTRPISKPCWRYIEAMRDSLERLGRFDPEQAQEQLRAGFGGLFIERDGALAIGFALRPDGADFGLDHLYVVPAAQRLGVGGQVLGRLLLDADRRGLAVSVGALRGNDSNRFYRRHGFAPVARNRMGHRIPAPGGGPPGCALKRRGPGAGHASPGRNQVRGRVTPRWP